MILHLLCMSLSSRLSAFVEINTSHKEINSEIHIAIRLKPKICFPNPKNPINNSNIERVQSKMDNTPKNCIQRVSSRRCLKFSICWYSSQLSRSCDWRCKSRMSCATAKKRFVYAKSKSETAGKSNAGVEISISIKISFKNSLFIVPNKPFFYASIVYNWNYFLYM